MQTIPRNYPNSDRGPVVIPSDRRDQVIGKQFRMAAFSTDADALALLILSYAAQPGDGGNVTVNPTNATITVVQNGAGSNQALITLAVKNSNNGSANSDVTFAISCTATAATTGWASNAATAFTLKDVIDLINAGDGGGTSGKLLRGFHAEIGPGGRYDMILTGALHLQNLSATYINPPGIPSARTKVVKMDHAVWTEDSDFMLQFRIGNPTGNDNGGIKMLDLWGAIGTDTGATVTIVRDAYEDYVLPTGTWATDLANHAKLYEVAAANLPSGANYVGAYALPHEPHCAPVWKGPLLVIVKGDTDAAQTVDISAAYQNVPTMFG